MRKILIPVFIMLALDAHAQQYTATRQLLSSTGADTWAATDGLGRRLPCNGETGNVRKDRFVGIFYFVWHGAHGYDQHRGNSADEGVMPKLPGDTASPYDISRLLAANPDHPAYGPLHAFHYWGEPYFGYYLPDDEWIIRKHAQMLSDAGVDVIVLDVTNAAIYLPQVSRIAAVYRQLRASGQSVPGIAFMVNTEPEKTARRLFEQVYRKGLFSDCWFYWKGKPLLLCPPEAATPEMKDFFSIRQSWAWSDPKGWFGNGQDKWTWLDHTPQTCGWHESPDRPEQISVNIAEHPVTNIGRSFHKGRQPPPGQQRPAEGLNFAEQWQRALAADPEFVFVTGWNEWVAMRFTAGKDREFIGRPIKKGDSYFVDLYNEEYSRDAEPVNGSLHDNYYYQLISGIRRFKGARPASIANMPATVRIDGRFADWQKVSPVFYDDAGDTFHRHHPGWGRIARYENTTGRNDIVEARVATDAQYISFYVKTAAPLSSRKDSNWMQLYIRTGDTTLAAWEGFSYRVNGQPAGRRSATLERCTGGWHWERIADIRYAAAGNELELRIPRAMLPGTALERFEIGFKWCDNTDLEGQAVRWLDKGDAAPNARFYYRYIYERQPVMVTTTYNR